MRNVWSTPLSTCCNLLACTMCCLCVCVWQTCGNCPADCGPCQSTADVLGCQESNKYAMTFDDGPSQFSNALMDILTANNVQVSYFLVGMQIDAFKAQINREVRVVVQAASGSERQRVATSHSTGWSGLCMSSACCCRCWRRPLPSCSRAPLLPT
jgi:hypothetical protein